MGIIKSINDWEVGIGESTGDFIQNTLNEAGSFLCSVRRKYPNSFFDRSFGRGLANSICRTFDEIPLPEPQPSFIGGQCEGVEYDVSITYETNPQQVEDRFRTERMYGPIVGVYGKVNSIGANEIGITAATSATDPTPRDYGLDIIDSRLNVRTSRKEITQIVRVDGQADDCGNPPPSYGVDPERDPNDFRTVRKVSEYDEDGNVIFSRDVEFELEEKDNYDFPVCIKVDGKEICLDADGWDVSDQPVEDEEEKEEDEEEIEILEAVTVSVNQLPIKFNKRITRQNSKDSEIFAGYLAWSKVVNGTEYFYPAIPIRKEKNIFMAPEGVESYSVYYNFELTGVVREIKKKVKVPKQPEDDDDTI